MYEQHFGLAKPPFRITPDPAFFFAGANRGAVLEALIYAVTRGEGIIKVVGEVGSGKTMLCRMLERELPKQCEKIYLANPRLAPDDILHAIAFELGLEVRPEHGKLEVMRRLHDHLLRRHVENRRVILFVEEAQSMPLDTLEEIRLLSNLETSENKLLQIVLFGQPELDAKLEQHAIRQLKERITHSFALAPLSRTAVRDYVVARLTASGQRGAELFEPGAIKMLTRHSQGLLRRINVLADKALLAAFAAQASAVSAAHVTRAARDSQFEAPAAFGRWASYITGFAIGLAILAAALVWWRSPGREIVLHAPRPAAPSIAAPVLEPKLAAPAQLRSSAADSPVAAVTPRPAQDNPALLPQVSPSDGLVGTAHLRPLIEGPPSASEIAAALAEGVAAEPADGLAPVQSQ